MARDFVLPPGWTPAAPPDLVRLGIAAALAEAYEGVENEPLPEPLRAALRELERCEASSRDSAAEQREAPAVRRRQAR